MKKQISFRQYRAMDLFLFTALLCGCEALITLGATRWFPGEPYTLSITPAVTAIVMVRWGIFAAIPAVFGAGVFCFASGAALPQYFIYCIGNLASLLLTRFFLRSRLEALTQQRPAGHALRAAHSAADAAGQVCAGPCHGQQPAGMRRVCVHRHTVHIIRCADRMDSPPAGRHAGGAAALSSSRGGRNGT